MTLKVGKKEKQDDQNKNSNKDQCMTNQNVAGTANQNAAFCALN
jgi:hypothetical protein